MEFEDTPLFATAAFLLVMSILLNFLGIYLLSLGIQTASQNILLVNLSCADVFLALAVCAYHLIASPSKSVSRVMDGACGWAYSVLILSVISIASDRVFGIYWPLKRRTMATKKFFQRIVISTWCCALPISTIFVAFPKKFHLIVMGQDLVLVMVTIVSYSLVLRKLVKRKTMENIASERAREAQQRNVFRNHTKFLKVCGMIMVEYIVFQLIPNVLVFATWGKEFTIGAQIVYVMQGFSFFLHPMIYIFFLPNVRASLISKIGTVFRCCKKKENTSNSAQVVADAGERREETRM